MSTKTSVDGQFLDYRIEEPLGRGGMGVVYAAHDLRLKRKVALKLMAPELALDERFRERFSREAELAMSLEHPNVVPIHDAGEANGRLYLVMRCVDGTDLRMLLREQGALEPVRALAIVAQVAQALDAAHANGLVHRDVKPSNVLLDENDHVYLADFGLTRRQSAEAAALGDMRSLGTPSYLAPEQIDGGPIDGRADVYSLGCLLFECLTGEPPFAGASHLGVAWAHLEEEPPSASERNPELPDAIDGVIRKAMAKDREQRYSTCVEFVEHAAAALGRPSLKRSRRRLAALSAVLGVALVVAAVVATRIAGTGPDYLTSVAPNSVAAIDADAARIVAQVPLGPRPGAIASGGGYLWVADAAEGTVSRIDRDLALVRRIDVGDSVDGLAYGRRSIWATDANAGQLVQIDAETARIVQRFRVGNGPAAVAAGDDAVWVANRIDGTLSRLDLAKAKVAKPIAIGSAPAAIALGGGAVWVTDEDAGTILRLDPASGKIVRSIRVGNGPTAIAFADGMVWVTNRQDDTVSRIASATGVASDPIPVGSKPAAIAADRDHVWVANSGDRTVTRIPARTGERETLTLGSSPTAVALDERRLWLSTSPGLATHRGGVLRLRTEPSLCRCVDPAFGTGEIFNSTDQNVTTLVYDGLMAYRRVGGIAGASLVPNLAARMPVRSADGKGYRFELRRGVRFSNGALVQASDFRASMERVLTVNGDVGRRGYGRIVGSSACGRAKERCDLSRGIRVDDSAGTVTIRLTEPDADFLHKLALPLASVVPSWTTRRVAREEAPPGTGAYRIALVSRGEIRLVRNPHFRVWSSDARPDGYPDEIRFRAHAVTDQGTESAIRAVESGNADWVELAGVPGERVRGLLAGNAGSLHINPQPFSFWFYLNTRVPPFDDVRVRRALNYATDRGRLARLPAPLSARPACQILPPSFPGYRPFCPYTVAPNEAGTWVAPDMAKARGLVRASGTAGTKIEVLGVRGQIPLELARYFASVLRGLGYRTSLRVFPDFVKYFEYAGDARNRAQIGQAGITASILAPSEFFQPFSCSDGVNQAGFCDPKLDTRMRRASALQASNPARANRLWSEIERELVRRAPIVSVANVRQRVFVSRRVGNHQGHPLWGTLVDQLWVD